MSAHLGEVEITLNGRVEKLRCSLRAARTVSGFAGGFTGAYERLARFDLAIYSALVVTGLDKRGPTDISAIEQEIYDTGLEQLATPLTRYVSMLMNGGREPTSPTEGALGNG